METSIKQEPGTSKSFLPEVSISTDNDNITPSTSKIQERIHSNYEVKNQNTLFSREHINRLVKSVDPSGFLSLDLDAQDILSEFAEKYAENLVNGACSVAVHRQGKSVQPKDVQMYLQKMKDSDFMELEGERKPKPSQPKPSSIPVKSRKQSFEETAEKMSKKKLRK